MNDGRSIYVSRSSDHIPEEDLHREQWKFEEFEGLQVPVGISPDVETQHPEPTSLEEREKGYFQREDLFKAKMMKMRPALPSYFVRDQIRIIPRYLCQYSTDKINF